MKSVCLFCLMVASTCLWAQSNSDIIEVPMDPQHWEFDSSLVNFVDYQGVPSMQGLPGSSMLLKEVTFSNGTIEFDVGAPKGFVSINFRGSDDGAMSEIFYLRAFWPVSPQNRTALQYAAVLDNINMWDVTDDYQTAAVLNPEEWNHVKLVINGKQLLAYVNESETPSMHVPILEGELDSGSISFAGTGHFANLRIMPDQTADLPSTAGYDRTMGDPHYLRSWEVTEPIDFPQTQDLTEKEVPDSNTSWQSMQAEQRALVNLTRRFGGTPRGERRLVWLRTTIESESNQSHRLDLGFSDEVWVLINGQLLHLDHNHFGTPSMKEPRGRCTLANTSFDLPLREGENELMIGVSNYFFGWGIIARLADTRGVLLQENIVP